MLLELYRLSRSRLHRSKWSRTESPGTTATVSPPVEQRGPQISRRTAVDWTGLRAIGKNRTRKVELFGEHGNVRPRHGYPRPYITQIFANGRLWYSDAPTFLPHRLLPWHIPITSAFPSFFCRTSHRRARASIFKETQGPFRDSSGSRRRSLRLLRFRVYVGVDRRRCGDAPRSGCALSDYFAN